MTSLAYGAVMAAASLLWWALWRSSMSARMVASSVEGRAFRVADAMLVLLVLLVDGTSRWKPRPRYRLCRSLGRSLRRNARRGRVSFRDGESGIVGATGARWRRRFRLVWRHVRGARRRRIAVRGWIRR